MRFFSFAIAVLTAALSNTSASATVVISNDIGGKMEDYTARYQQVRQSGEAVVIDGMCLSACTMVLGLVPRERICATANAVLGFHAAWEFDGSGTRIPSPSGTRELMRAYPSTVRAWIGRHGGLKPGMMFLRGRELAAVVPPCGDGARTATASQPRHAGVRQVRRADTRRASLDAH
jgi:hypothetical protein